MGGKGRKGGGGGKGGGYDWRQHVRPSSDPNVHNKVRQKLDAFEADTQTQSFVVEVWGGPERNTWRSHCRDRKLAFLKGQQKGFWVITKVPKLDNSIYQLLHDFQLHHFGPDGCDSKVLLRMAKQHPTLGPQLFANGITNFKGLTWEFDAASEWFNIDDKWLSSKTGKPGTSVSPEEWSKGLSRGAFGEFAKPVELGDGGFLLLQQAVQATEHALQKVAQPMGRFDVQSLQVAFPRQDPDHLLEKRAAKILSAPDSPEYQKLIETRQRLPGYQRKQEVLDAFATTDVVVVCGATGCGKTTQLPQFLMEAVCQGSNRGRVICTQPRRISATSVAERVAQERGESLGDTVGYQIRFETRASENTALLYCTVGILLRHLTSNPTLEGVSVVVVDEVHERDVNADFALLILRDLVVGPRRGTLKLVLMSATINAEGFLAYFEKMGASTRLVEIPGKTNFPITEYWAEDIFQDVLPNQTQGFSVNRQARSNKTRNVWATTDQAVASKLGEVYPGRHFRPEVVSSLLAHLQRPLDKPDYPLIANLVLHISRNLGPGAVLIFAPGWAEISACVKELEAKQREANERWRILPLHSLVQQKDQRLVFQQFPGERKIIVATNIAETSITVEDVVFVIDPGTIKGTTYAPETNIATLGTLPISRSNGQQRRGRAGRVRPGCLFRLYSRIEWESFDDCLLPEMQRTPVEELCLQVRALGIDGPIEDILNRAIDAPAEAAIDNALTLLCTLGALDEHQQLTNLGWKLATMPLHPSLGKMVLLGTLFGCPSHMLTICATLSFKSPFVLPMGKEKEADQAKKQLADGLESDHLLFAYVVSEYQSRPSFDWCSRNFLSKATLDMILKTRQDLFRYLHHLDVVPEEHQLQHRVQLTDERKAELLAVVAGSLGLATKVPGTPKFQCLEGSRRVTKCSVHPSSCVEYLSSPKRRRGGGQELSVVCWFSRLKTADVYMHDVSLLQDVLPLLLLAPQVRRRGASTVFEVTPACVQSTDADDPAQLLLQVQDGVQVADAFWRLRQAVQALLDRLLAQKSTASVAGEAEAALSAVRKLLVSSYKHCVARDHATTCVTVAENGAASSDEDADEPAGTSVQQPGQLSGGFSGHQANAGTTGRYERQAGGKGARQAVQPGSSWPREGKGGKRRRLAGDGNTRGWGWGG
mmetsp:Transcript_4761/g.11570  ORF Transcript_4761/g.11570 Transcript_4761/m.11570 type:complete len:1162 (+) Transcript_4761:43-3528(+)